MQRSYNTQHPSPHNWHFPPQGLSQARRLPHSLRYQTRSNARHRKTRLFKSFWDFAREDRRVVHVGEDFFQSKIRMEYGPAQFELLHGCADSCTDAGSSTDASAHVRLEATLVSRLIRFQQILVVCWSSWLRERAGRQTNQHRTGN